MMRGRHALARRSDRQSSGEGKLEDHLALEF